jgi:mono/diheme cytochrome c family protein
MKKRLVLVGLLGFLLGLAVRPAIAMLGGGSGAPLTVTNVKSKNRERNPALAAKDELLAGSSTDLHNPLPITDSNLTAGLKIFRNNCAGCHGEPGRPSRWGTRNFFPPVPQFADEPPQLADSKVFVIVKRGIKYSGMGGWDGMLPDEDIWKVAAFLSRLHELPPAVDSMWNRRS